MHVPPPLIFACAFALGWLLQRRFPFSAWPRSLGRVLAWPCLAGSALLAAWGFSWFMRRRTSPIPFRPSAALITSGPYRFSRNPLYLSLVLLYASLALRFAVPWAVLFLFPALAALQRWIIAEEERGLERQFGRDYLDYKTRVRRWL